MFCPECSKLAVLHTKRVCVRCKGEILNNISCICDKCSKEQNKCSACLKRISVGQDGIIKHVFRPGCKTCGKGLK